MNTRIDELKRPFQRSRTNTTGPKGPRKRAPKPTGRNKGVKFTIQALRAEHKALGGHFFDREQPTGQQRIHGHPVTGPGGVFFIMSRKLGFKKDREYLIYNYNPKNGVIEQTEGSDLTHGAALDRIYLLAD